MVDWHALQDIMQELGFPQLFVSWIMTTVTTVSYKFNINGKYTDRMEARRGIRQGDPLSPLLFVIIMEYLNRLLLQMQHNPNFNHHSKCEQLQLTNMIFVDDLLLFARGNQGSIALMQHTLQIFLESTGLKVNPSKSRIYFGAVPRHIKSEILQMTAYTEGTLPFRYLGVPVTRKNLSLNHYLPLIDKLMHRITHWSARLLSYAGRLQLIKSVLYATTTFWLQCLLLPKTVLRKIDVICRSFLWTGGTTISRKSPISWKKVCRPKTQGGLNLMDLDIWNKVFLLKLLWNICAKTDSLWVRWIHTYYMKHTTVMNREIKNDDSGIFKAIMQRRGTVALVQSLWDTMLQEGKFNGRKLYKALLPDAPTSNWCNLVLHNTARPKAVFILWLMCHGRLATRMRLHRLGLITNTQCVFCASDETLDHLFFGCLVSKQIWCKVLH
jgi:hypothetical protein